VIAATGTLRKLEIGPRPGRMGPEWSTVGLDTNDYTDHICIWGVQTLPFEDGTFDEVYASHVIEHVPWWRVVDALKDAFRVLKSGGGIELHTVDFSVLVTHYLNKTKADGWKGGGKNADGHPTTWLASRLFSYGDYFHDPQWHHSLFDADYLAYCIERAGFVRPERCGPPRGPEKHGVIDLGMKAVKP
jgi:predicted SAM-dependent methyltransferase